MMRTSCLIYLLILAPGTLLLAGDEGAPSASDIMVRVAVNQDRAQKLRGEYVYQQHVRVATARSNGKLAREEFTDYVVTPTADGTKKELKNLSGRYWYKGKYLEYHGEPTPQSDSVDGSLVRSFRDDVINDQSKDGLGGDLFPLTTKEQQRYSFALAGEETLRGRKVFRVRFQPLDKDDLTWAGEAVIDAEEFEPLSVFTHLSRRIPLLVRSMLGTDLPGVGFNVEYRRFDEGVWFPVSFGTEFRLHVLFFLNRDIAVSVENSHFQRAKVESKILDYQVNP
jgi:hypothetical protein